jgi:hypothetical protein
MRTHPAVIYDLYNEPHDVSWDIWLNGGEITDRPNRRSQTPKTFMAVGVPKDEAAFVTDCLVRANLKGVDSHGVQQIQGTSSSSKQGRSSQGQK